MADEPATVACACISYDPESDEDYAPCECGHAIEEHEDGPCEGEVDAD